MHTLHLLPTRNVTYRCHKNFKSNTAQYLHLYTHGGEVCRRLLKKPLRLRVACLLLNCSLKPYVFCMDHVKYCCISISIMPMETPSQKGIFVSECLTIFHVYKTRNCCLEPLDSSPFVIPKIYWLLTDNGWWHL